MTRVDRLRGLAVSALRRLRAAVDTPAAADTGAALGPEDVALEAGRVLELLQMGEDLRLIDLRTDDEVAEGGLADGAERSHPEAVAALEGELVLLCRDGQRSVRVALALREEGRRAWSVAQGTRGWGQAGGTLINLGGEPS